jgi:hypothetical protein
MCSALGDVCFVPKADIGLRGLYVCFGGKADIGLRGLYVCFGGKADIAPTCRSVRLRSTQALTLWRIIVVAIPRQTARNLALVAGPAPYR